MQTIYRLSKILLTPEIWIFVGLGIGCTISWITRCHRFMRVTLCVVLLLYYAFTTRPLAQGLVQPLETYYRPSLAGAPHDALVLLVDNPSTELPLIDQPSIVVTQSADVLMCGLIYARANVAPKVVLGQGVSEVITPHKMGPSLVEELAVLLGYPREGIITNEHGMATHERARSIKMLLGSNTKILLIDSAMHLPRSAATFRKAGFTVTPIPCAYSILSTKPWSPFDLVPGARNLEASSDAVYEYLGLAMYWLCGLI